MFCKNCGTQIVDGDLFCKSCGTPVAAVKTETEEVKQEAVNAQPVTPPVQPAQPVTPQPQTQATTVAPQPSKKNNNSILIVIAAIACCLVIGLGILVVILLIGTSEIKNDVKDDQVESENQKEEKEEEDKSSYFKVKLGGFEMKVPDTLRYQEKEDALVIGNEDDTWAAQLNIVEGSYAQLKSNKSNMKTNFINNGYTSSDVEVQTIGDVEFITAEVGASGTNYLLGYAKGNAMYIIGVTTFDIDNEFNYDILEEIEPVIESATYVGETNNMENTQNLTLNMSGIPELAKE